MIWQYSTHNNWLKSLSSLVSATQFSDKLKKTRRIIYHTMIKQRAGLRFHPGPRSIFFYFFFSFFHFFQSFNYNFINCFFVNKLTRLTNVYLMQRAPKKRRCENKGCRGGGGNTMERRRAKTKRDILIQFCHAPELNEVLFSDMLQGESVFSKYIGAFQSAIAALVPDKVRGGLSELNFDIYWINWNVLFL